MRFLILCPSILLSCTLMYSGLVEANSDPLFSGPRAERNRKIFKEIKESAMYILKEFNAEKKFRGFENEISNINSNLELLFLGIDAKAVGQSLHAETESLEEVCFLNSNIDTLEIMARSQGKTIIRKELDTQLLKLSLPCLQKR